uniref:Uncharacterized protein n=1 Tax=Rhizophora mucronata TaxID=61149 RepID=A0A2P2IKZ0_RHIMU
MIINIVQQSRLHSFTPP